MAEIPGGEGFMGKLTRGVNNLLGRKEAPPVRTPEEEQQITDRLKKYTTPPTPQEQDAMDEARLALGRIAREKKLKDQADQKAIQDANEYTLGDPLTAGRADKNGQV